MTPKLFLKISGVLLIGLGLLGIFNILGSFSQLGFFHPPYWINWVHLAIGVFIFIASFKSSYRIQSRIVLIPAVLATSIGVLGLLFGSYISKAYNIPELKDPSDHIAHLIVGFIAIWALSSKKKFKKD